jgi:S-adenosylmethionine hydrolase
MSYRTKVQALKSTNKINQLDSFGNVHLTLLVSRTSIGAIRILNKKLEKLIAKENETTHIDKGFANQAYHDLILALNEVLTNLIQNENE